ncbi:exonuclease subunit SbcD [Candidatus Dependentiae bacterium]|nr:exonuclease subunit SbcD [Candidatus Dependentiae bacterium]
MIKFFHTADIHLGVENYGKINSITGVHSRLQDFKNSFQQCIDLAIKEKIDFFLFCGDAYKTAFPTPTHQKILMNLFFQLKQANIPIVSIIGNHDHPLSFGKVNSLDILSEIPTDGFYVFSKPDILNLETKNGPIQIIGIPWPTRNNIITDKKFHLKDNIQITNFLSQAVSNIIKNLASKLDPRIPSILAGHLTVGTGIFSGSEKCAIFGNDPVFFNSQLSINNFDYVALGHLHRHQNLNSNSYPPVVYSGSIERIDFGERKEAKGFCKVEIDVKKKTRCLFEFVKLNIRPMIQVEVFLEKNKNQTEQILEEMKKIDIKDSILKIIYHIPEDTKDKVDLQQIQRACLPAMHLVSVNPIRKPEIKERRTTLKIDMNIDSLLEKYLDGKNISEAKKKKLIEKTSLILKDLDSEDT